MFSFLRQTFRQWARKWSSGRHPASATAPSPVRSPRRPHAALADRGATLRQQPPRRRSRGRRHFPRRPFRGRLEHGKLPQRLRRQGSDLRRLRAQSRQRSRRCQRPREPVCANGGRQRRRPVRRHLDGGPVALEQGRPRHAVPRRRQPRPERLRRGRDPTNEYAASAGIDAHGDFVVSYTRQVSGANTDVKAACSTPAPTLAGTVAVAATPKVENNTGIAVAAVGSFAVSYTSAARALVGHFSASGQSLDGGTQKCRRPPPPASSA